MKKKTLLLAVLMLVCLMLPAAAYAAPVAGPSGSWTNPDLQDEFAPAIPETPQGSWSGSFYETPGEDQIHWGYADLPAVLRAVAINRTPVYEYRWTMPAPYNEELIWADEAGYEELDNVLENAFRGMYMHTGDPRGGDYIYHNLGNYGWSTWADYDYGAGYIYTLHMEIQYKTTADQEAYVDTAVAQYVYSHPRAGRSDAQVLKEIYKYICDNVAYDYSDAYDYDSYLLKHTAYQALHDHTAVCQGYALLLYRMTLEYGIDCRIVNSWAMNHAWNIAKINGYWYSLDVTWDETVTDPRDYWYFLKGTSYMTSTYFHGVNGVSEIGYLGFEDIECTAVYAMPSENWDEATSGFTGLYNDGTTIWLMVNGQIDTSYTGLYNDATYGWVYIWAGHFAQEKTGLIYDNTYGWWYVEGGLVAFYKTGLIQDDALGWWYVEGGQITFAKTGLVNDPAYGWWYVEGSYLSFAKTGLVYDPAYGWWYVENSYLSFAKTGLISDPQYGWWYVEGSYISFAKTGLVYDPAYGWWYVAQNCIDFTYRGLVYDPYYGTWYVNGGTIDFTYNGEFAGHVVTNGYAVMG